MQLRQCLRSGLTNLAPFLSNAKTQGPVTHLDPCCDLTALVVLPLPRLDRSHLHPRPLQRALVRLQPTAST